MSTPLTIWTNHRFDDAHTAELRQRVAPRTIAWSQQTSRSNLAQGTRDPAALEAEVLYGQPHPQDILESTRLRWVQLSSAGYTRYDQPQFLEALRERGIAFCNASSVYDEPCAQHVVALLLAMARALPQAMIEQQHAQWNSAALRGQSFLVQGQTVALVGYGAIAARVAELLAPFNLEITAFRRNVRGDEKVRTLPIAELDAFLPRAQIIVNVLPLSPQTEQFFNAERFARMQPGSIYINIGRGNTNDQEALADALESGLVAQAYLDVTHPEPLPPEHRLWRLSNCHITPHTAGGSYDEPRRMIDHFLQNLHRFEQGQPLRDRIV